MNMKKFTQKQANEMYKTLVDIHCGLKDKNMNKKPLSMPFIDIAWMASIENFLPKRKQIIKNRLNKYSIK